jgi:iron complex transport system substrate-binding protein
LLLRLLFIPLLLLKLSASELEECTDVSLRADKIYGASPPVNYLLYALDPALMAGLNFPLRPNEEKYLGDVSRLPVIGGWFGQGRTPNLETLAAVKPDLTVAWNYRGDFGRIARALSSLGLASCALRLDSLDDYPAALRALGRITRHEARAKALALDFERRLRDAETRRLVHTGQTPPRVYYAEGPGGLKTECSGSVHAELIERAGGVNVHRCEAKSGYGMEEITFEQLLVYDPDVIIAFNREFFDNVFRDSRFARLDAIKNGRVYLIPRTPVNWFDRPPSFMRVAGLEWLQWILWPGASDEPLVQSLQSFFSLYFNRGMNQEAIRSLIRYKQEEKR